MTLLGAKLAAAPAPAKAETLLAKARATHLRGEYAQLPLYGRVWIELAGEHIVDEIESEVFSAMAELKLLPLPINEMTYESRRAALTLAWAVRNPDVHAEHFGDADEWIKVDIDMISACIGIYVDVRTRLNPLGIPLTTADLEEIRLGIEKKNPMLLRSCGAHKLSLYLASMESPRASSPEATSSTGE